MPLGLMFWILMLLWLIFGLVERWGPSGPYWAWGGSLVLFILLLLLGWQVFGAPVK